MSQKQAGRGVLLAALICACVLTQASVQAQSQNGITADAAGTSARPITIPLTIRVKGSTPEQEIRMVDLSVTEDGDPQKILYIRAMGSNSPITIAVLIQDDLVSSVSNEIKPLREFIQQLPRGSRVMVGYIRAGSLQVRQKFTTDLERAAKTLRTPVGAASAAPFNPYVEVVEALRRFDSQPSGRRAILLVSDGLDTSRGVDSSSAAQSVDLQRAIAEAQRRSAAIYSFYSPTIASQNNIGLIANGQSSLLRLSDETGGEAFFQGTGAPVSFDPYLRKLMSALDRQIALTYLSTHTGKGFHRVHVRSSAPGIDVAYPTGYSRK
jgi:VWFA-related protein